MQWQKKPQTFYLTVLKVRRPTRASWAQGKVSAVLCSLWRLSGRICVLVSPASRDWLHSLVHGPPSSIIKASDVAWPWPFFPRSHLLCEYSSTAFQRLPEEMCEFMNPTFYAVLQSPWFCSLGKEVPMTAHGGSLLGGRGGNHHPWLLSFLPSHTLDSLFLYAILVKEECGK